MIFEVGKYYQHTDGGFISIVGKVDTKRYGEVLVAEEATNKIILTFSNFNDNVEGWSEITKHKWLSKFFEESKLPSIFTERFMTGSNIINNNKIYGKSIIKNIIDYCNTNTVYGFLDNDENKVTNKISNVREADGALYCDVELLDNEFGRTLWMRMQEEKHEFYLGALIDTIPHNYLNLVTSCKVLHISSRPINKGL